MIDQARAAVVLALLFRRLEAVHFDNDGLCQGCGLTSDGEGKSHARCPVRTAITLARVELSADAPPSETALEVALEELRNEAIPLTSSAGPFPPYVGLGVHYVSHGSPRRDDGTQEYPSVCRAATVTVLRDTGVSRWAGSEPQELDYPTVGLAVFSEGGLLFADAQQDEDGFAGGTWHFMGNGPRCPL
jgi:hypothetical protein